MRHRHIVEGHEHTVPAVEDVLDRGTVADRRDLAAVVRADPRGATATALATVLSHTDMYGTTRLWRRFLERLDIEAQSADRRAPETAAPGGTAPGGAPAPSDSSGGRTSRKA